MNVGMLWFDNDPKKALDEKITQAAEFFKKKYGQAPDTCMVSPGMLTGAEHQVVGVTVRQWRTVTPGHLWIGVEDKHEQQAVC